MIKSLILIMSISLMQPNLLFDFNPGSDTSVWSIVNDVVMGGRSSASLELNKDGHGEFSGRVSLANNGGFSSIRHRPNISDVSKYSVFNIRLKGDGKPYQFRVKSESSDYYSYTINFGTTGQWQNVEIPFSDLSPTFRGRALDIGNYPGTDLEEIGFLIGNNKAEEFVMLIDYIKLK